MFLLMGCTHGGQKYHSQRLCGSLNIPESLCIEAGSAHQSMQQQPGQTGRSNSVNQGRIQDLGIGNTGKSRTPLEGRKNTPKGTRGGNNHAYLWQYRHTCVMLVSVPPRLIKPAGHGQHRGAAPPITRPSARRPQDGTEKDNWQSPHSRGKMPDGHWQPSPNRPQKPGAGRRGQNTPRAQDHIHPPSRCQRPTGEVACPSAAVSSVSAERA